MLTFVNQVHITDSSPVAEHCSTYSLSDPSDADHRQLCAHIHDQKCDQCTGLSSALSDIEKLLREIPFRSEDDRDEAFYLYQSASLAIQAWRCHQLRTVRQDQARLDALDLLDERTVLLVNDWAMKFIPQKYRESQADWSEKGEFHGTYLLRTVKLTDGFSRRVSSIQSSLVVRETQL